MKREIELQEVQHMQEYNDLTEEFTFAGKGYLIKWNGENVGCMEAYREDEETLHVEQLEINSAYKGKGIGRNVTGVIKEHFGVSKVVGISSSGATGFWENLGARFTDTCESCSYEGCIYNKAFVPIEGEDYDDSMCDDYSDRHFVLNLN